MLARTILLRPLAPPKPAVAAACNGCGVCCAAEPCPLGRWLSGRRHGECAALVWRDDDDRYACGVLDDPGRWLPWLPTAMSQRLARRWIAAGQGCDCSFEVDPAPADAAR